MPAEGSAELSALQAELKAFLKDKLPPYKVPREFRVLEMLPRNPTGKIMRRALSERLKAEG
jgi:acyl-coenzyme A synthetase/AMP-(fatty) acid ligase